MPRPKKNRMVCHVPNNLSFSPEDGGEKEPVILAMDEYETIRLIDWESLSQEQCAERMQIARTTVQMIYAAARRKLAQVLVEGRSLQIQGGDYRLCDGRSPGCGEHACFKQMYKQKYEKPKGDNIMRIAVTYENGEVFQHFGHTQMFKVYDVQDGKVIAAQVVDTMGSGHGALAGVLNALQADVLICGGIGGGAQMALAQAGIQFFGGVTGSADGAVQAYLEGKLSYNPNVRCNHHDHHGEGHTCGDHGCGSHSCH